MKLLVTRNNTSRIPTSVNPTPKMSSNGYSRIAHSQPGSRSTSPTPKYSYLTHTNANLLMQSPSHNNYYNNDLAGTPSSYSNGRLHSATLNRSGNSSAAVKSKIPTSSRNSSRESSPGRRSSKTHRN